MVKKIIINEFLKKNVVYYIFGFITLITSSVLLMVTPKLLGIVIDGLTDRSFSLEDVKRYVAYMLGLGLAVFALSFSYRMLIMGRARHLECFLREKLFSHFQTLSPRYYNEKKTGDLMAYAINDLGAIRMAFSMGTVFFVEGVLVNIFPVAIMVRTINPMLTIVTILPVFVSLLIVVKMRKSIRKRFTIVQEAFADLSDKIQENISGIRVVKAYVQEKKEIEKLNNASLHRADVQLEYVKLSALIGPFSQIAFGLSFTLELVIGGIMVVENKISLGDFVAFNTYLGMLMRPVMMIGRIVEVWQRAFASINRLDDVFCSKTDITDKHANKSVQEIKGEIALRDFSFSYPKTDKNALSNISIQLQPGKTLGIIGKTGSGKTTLANILLRLYKVKSGSVFIDNMDINSIPLSTLRTSIGYSPQDNFLFADTILQNIRFYELSISDDKIYESAKFANVYDNIIDFPDGFDTLIGERGITLSGGQKQRVSISRAIAKNAKILILDDSFSAVDADTEEKILAKIKETQGEKTVIYIAHRISTIAHCDEIIYMNNGKIVERGNHEELLSMQGAYYNLNRIQSMEKDFDKGAEA